MYIINPDPYSLPAYRIGPFTTRDIGLNHLMPACDLIDDYFTSRFGGRQFFYTQNGRSAINLALSRLSLRAEDVVTILTTTGNFYISGCVTREIEKYCRWSREFVPETKVILVNHEFGFPYPDLSRLKDRNLPIIEDCAGAFFSEDKDASIGEVGDYIIYSFPKMFPLQVGGLIVSRDHSISDTDVNMTPAILRYIKNVLSRYIEERDLIVQKRFYNYKILKDSFSSLGLQERFTIREGVVPNVYMFRTDNTGIDLPDLKEYFWAHGIQSSVFYGEEAFFIPVHQALTESDLEYFYEVMRSFLQRIYK